MKTRPLQNYGASVGVEAYDIDWNNPEEVLELGRLTASQCIVYVDEKISTKQLYDTMSKWGDDAIALLHEYITKKKITGRHWREVLLHLGYVSNEFVDINAPAVSVVSYKKGENGRPGGIFQNGELDWHSDQCAFDDGQRMIGLQSVSDSANSQTTFLCTHDAFESLSSDMRSMVKELVVRHVWRDGLMAPGLNSVQSLIIQYNMVPLEGMETKLYHETASGLSGMKIPSYSFDGFVGMSQEESYRVLNELHQAVFKPEYVYTQNWKDGEIVFMDQEITLHARPTNIEDGNKRTMARCITYLNKVYDNEAARKATHVRWNGNMYSHDEFCHMVDQDRKRIFELAQKGHYAKLDDEVWAG